jgi:hypothetical protein
MGPFGLPQDYPTPVSSQDEFLELFRADAWSQNVVLLIDEFSKLHGAEPNIQDECLWAFQKIKNNNEMYAICTVIAAGTFDIVYLNPLNSTISPFNVTNHVQNPYFSIKEVMKLFHEFAQDHHITIDDAIVEDIWAKLNGCVTLLNWSMRAQVSHSHPAMVCLCGVSFSRTCSHYWTVIWRMCHIKTGNNFLQTSYTTRSWHITHSLPCSSRLLGLKLLLL